MPPRTGRSSASESTEPMMKTISAARPPPRAQQPQRAAARPARRAEEEHAGGQHFADDEPGRDQRSREANSIEYAVAVSRPLETILRQASARQAVALQARGVCGSGRRGRRAPRASRSPARRECRLRACRPPSPPRPGPRRADPGSARRCSRAAFPSRARMRSGARRPEGRDATRSSAGGGRCSRAGRASGLVPGRLEGRQRVLVELECSARVQAAVISVAAPRVSPGRPSPA